MPEEVVEARIGDTGLVISFLLTDASRKVVRDLTGYAGWLSFWNEGAAEPHVARAALVDGTNGLVIYTSRGDEFTTAGKCSAQCTVAAPDWYLGDALGRSSHMTSTPPVTFTVKAAPA